jgi:hypothetical protein
MEANSVTPVKADYRPSGAQAQNELGDIFRDLLREGAWQFVMPVAPSRYDNRPDKADPRRDAVAEPTDTAPRARYDRFDQIDNNRNDSNAVWASISADPQPTHGPADTGDEAVPIDDAGKTPPTQKAESGQSAEDDGFKSAAVNTGAVQQGQTAETVAEAGAVANPPAAGVGMAPAPAGVQPSPANTSGSANPAAQVAVGPVADSSQAPVTAGSESQTPAKTTAPAQAAASQQAAATTATATTAGNGLAAQVSVKQAPVVSQPAANLGGGAATAALANATPQDVTGPAVPVADAASRAAQGASNTGTAAAATPGQTTPGAANPQGATPNAQVLPSDGQTVAAQSATAAGVAPKQNTTAATAPAPVSETPVGPDTDADQQKASIPAGPAAARTGTATGTPPLTSGEAAAALTGQNTAGSGDGAKIANTPNQESRAAPQSQLDLTPKAQTQAAQPANSAAPVAPVSQAQVLAENRAMGGTGGMARSSGAVDTVSGTGSSPAQVATGGFTQPALNTSAAPGSQTLSGAARSTPADQVAVEIQKAVGAGKDHVRVRLNPAELGQIDISLKVRHDGTIRAIVTADRPETFDLLQRDTRGLERALQDAGLKTDSGSLSFNLRGGENNGPNGGQRDPSGTAQASANNDQTVNSPPADLDVPIPVASSHALDIRV